MSLMNRPPVRSRGIALLELLVSLVLGFVVVAAVLINHVSASRSGRYLRAMSAMTEEAQMAMRLLGRDIQQAGDVDVIGLDRSNSGVLILGRQHVFRPVFGCATDFLAFAGNLPIQRFALSLCGAGKVSHGIEVSSLARPATTVGAAGVASDCLGNKVEPFDVAAGVTGAFNSNRYFVRQNGSGGSELFCESSASKSPQPVAEHVVAMRLAFGIAPNWTLGDRSSRRPLRYLDASKVADWSHVVAVRICLLMRSAAPVLSGEDPDDEYLDCDSQKQTASDRHLYRAFHSSVAIRNKAGF